MLQGQREGKEPGVLGIEGLADRVQPILPETIQVHVDRETQSLPVIAHVDLVREVHVGDRDAVAGQRLCGSVAKRAQLACDLLWRRIGELADDGSRSEERRVGEEGRAWREAEQSSGSRVETD